MTAAPDDGAGADSRRAKEVETAGPVANGDRAARLNSLLGRLPAAQQEVIGLAYFGHASHSEIAKQLGIGPGPVEGRMRFGVRPHGQPRDAAQGPP